MGCYNWLQLYILTSIRLVLLGFAVQPPGDLTIAFNSQATYPKSTFEKKLQHSSNVTINDDGSLFTRKFKFFYIFPSLNVQPSGQHNISHPPALNFDLVQKRHTSTQRNSSGNVWLLAPSFVALGSSTRELSDPNQRRLSVEQHKLRHFASIAGVPTGAIGEHRVKTKTATQQPQAESFTSVNSEQHRLDHGYRVVAPESKPNRYYIYADPARPRPLSGSRHASRLEGTLDSTSTVLESLEYHRQPRSFNNTNTFPEQQPQQQKTDRFKRRSAVDDMLSKNITIILENLLKRYENSQMPTHGQGIPTLVQTNILIRSMGPVSELDMDYSMDCYFRQYWRDKRLSFHGPIKSLSLSIKMLERIWRPDTYFYNGKHSHVHTITVPNKLLRLSQDGEILYSMRLTIKASCLMELRSFPMDRQSCPLVLGSYAYSRQQLLYQWKDEDSVDFVPGMTLSQFDLISFGQKNYTFIRREGEFSVLHVSFNLQRHTGYFLIQVYVPCILIVVLSWVSFWIHREATSDRVGLGITTVLTLSTISLDSRTDLPKVRYATALDWFLLMSFFYCIATLLEFAGVHYFTKVGSGEIPLDEEEWEDMEGAEEIRDLPSLPQHLSVPSAAESPRMIAARRRSSLICPIYNDPTHMFKPTSSHLSTMERTTQTEPPKEPVWKQVWLCFLGDDQFRRRRQREASARGGGNRHVNSVSLIDQAARILFPTSFMFFNILYWLVYYTYQADFTWSPLKEV
ncbi:gamma-aminobutyric acid receptor subunit alpha-6 [Anopheles nili]|uniref:gamma-aminobutyric acid receptor subunit alpha-6 n=1 Tax=Anopheles nili TaxID=185578 RepID=UPI00237A8E3B|nr:gamma-aminobutyric acid receptor subunit alpha-6 [Anopheles nili]